MINKNRLIKTFFDLVQIDSPSGEEKAVAKYVENYLKILGGEAVYDSHGNLIVKFKGKGEPLMLNAHLDTVEPGKSIKPIIKGSKIVSDGTTILGADAKAGVAAILEAVHAIKEANAAHVPLEVVMTLGEELGLLGAQNLDYSLLSAKRGVTFDGEFDVCNITTSAPGYSKVDIEITGKSAHAGVEPEKGVSAIKIAAELITKLKTGKIDAETTANIGTIMGGSVRNTVPDKAFIAAEIRSRNENKLQKHTEHFKKVIEEVKNRYPQASIDAAIEQVFAPYAFSKNNPTLQLVVTSLEKLKLKPETSSSGGGTDVNIFNTHGMAIICVGVGNYEMHTTREYLKINEFHNAASFCEQLIITAST